MRTLNRVLLHFLTVLLATGAAVAPAVARDAFPAPNRPKLIVFIVIDGLPQRQLLAYRDQLAPDGFNRFLQRGTGLPTPTTSMHSQSLPPGTPPY